MRLFQELGHQAVLIIGNYTALVGDPSGPRSDPGAVDAGAGRGQRSRLSAQVSKVIDITKTEVPAERRLVRPFHVPRRAQLTSKITVQRMLERDDFSKRFAFTARIDSDLLARMPLPVDAGAR